eukprot:INCI3113.1.p1 GENE.INCI3113.1~~INCI3113.1.p1  ORF type:complete len:391 (+),score=82.86 INCI3113.1:208-1380(+)
MAESATSTPVRKTPTANAEEPPLVDWTKLDLNADSSDGAGAASKLPGAGDEGGATPIDLSTLSFGETADASASDIFGSFKIGDDPFAASSPMAQIDFGFGDGEGNQNMFSDAPSESASSQKFVGSGEENAALAAGIEKRLALEAQLTELNFKLENFTEGGSEEEQLREETTAKIRAVEEELDALKKLHGDDIFGGFTFDPTAFDQSAPTGFDARHPDLHAGTTGTGDDDDGGDVDDSLLKLPDEALEGEALPSGHDDEEEVFRCRSRMHRFFKEHTYGTTTRQNIWFDLGRGDCIVFRHIASGVERLVFRQEHTQKVKSNFQLKGVLAALGDRPGRVIISNALSRTAIEDEYADAGAKDELQNVAFRFRNPADAERLLALCKTANEGGGD